MKHIFHKICFLVLLLPGIAVNSSAQINNPTWKADKLYNLFAYSEAIDEYEKVLVKHPDNAGAVRNLADCYRLTNNSVKAEKWYARAVDMPGARSIDKYYYAQALMYNAKYPEAKKAFSEYAALASADERASNAISGIDKMDDFFKDSAFAKITNLSINSSEAEFSAVPHNEGVVFVSSRVTGSKDKEHSWTGKPFLGLYYAKGSEANLGTPEPFSTDLQSKYNDGPATFEGDGKAMYFTRNSGTVSNKNDKVVKLQIVRSTIKEGKWVETESPSFNGKDYNCAHAWLTSDGKKMYFSSDMPGGWGGMDIYYSEKTDNTWGKPVNLGAKINTKGNDIFPTLSDENTLYFSSDGHIGLGGIDVYETKFVNGDWSEPRNMGYPINTHKDDFSLLLNKDGLKGYIASNRDGGKGDDDLYAVQIIKKIIIAGTVTDRKTGQPIGAADVVLQDEKGHEIGKVLTNADGGYEYELDINKHYTLYATKNSYSKEIKNVSTVDPPSARMVVDFVLDKLQLGVEGIVFDKETKEKLQNSIVLLLDTKDKVLATVTTAADGHFFFELETNKQYRLKASHEGYFSKSEIVSTKGKQEGIIRQDMPLEKLIINKPIRVENIYYDLAKWNIRPDAAKELDKLVQVLKDNPTIVIELSSHTDSRASDQYNMTLSDKRAKSAANYIITNGGIGKNRITGKGYGESMLINHCTNGAKCSEKDHQDNRRTEFKVIRFQ